ncbi:UTRA domain-containing protein [Kitasatospora sp. NPDC052896]|uniref:UTRA domain-containing protein n=1 Tax=Kitasatospora sp. NPDC052896 TaxID=3364061 RepID=UPI0037C98C68
MTDVVEHVTTRFPTWKEMELLHVTARTSLLAIQRVSTDRAGHVVEAALLALPGDRAEIRFTTHAPSRTEVAR